MNQKLTIPALLMSGLVTIVSLQGCGADTTSAPKARQLKKRPAMERPMPGRMQPQRGMPGGQMGPAGAMDTRAIVAGVARAQQTAPGFTATVETYDKGPKGTGTQTIKVAYKRPSTLKLTIVKDSGGNENTQALWKGSSDIQVKPNFPPVTVSLSLTDERLKSQNGWTLRDTEVGAILKVVLDPAAQIRVLGPQPMNGKLLTMLEVKSRQSPPGTTHEIVGIDPQTSLPGHRSIFKGQSLMYKIDIKSMKIGTPSSSELSI